MWFSDSIVVREKTAETLVQTEQNIVAEQQSGVDIKSTRTTIPFFKNNEFDYNMLIPGNEQTSAVTWIVFVIITILIITAVSNGANLTDGLDGLATGTSAIIGVVLGIFAYLSGNVIYSGYLNIMYIPNSGELVIFMGAFVGALTGFLWYNSYPAQVFMGDTGSLTIGGIIAIFAIMIRKELLIPILCGVFFTESLSVVLQVMYFKYTKRRYGAGRRIFKMTPLHHHFQKQGYAGIDAIIQRPKNPIPESKIAVRFWIITLLLAVISIVTLKLR
jgi:phospho-N-acetylmuramoyl-pentapeptide-transferase